VLRGETISYREVRFERTVKNGLICLAELNIEMAFLSGHSYELKVCQRLATLAFNGTPLRVMGTTAGSTTGDDIRFEIFDRVIGLECKTKGGFEGGGTKMTLVDGKLSVKQDGLLKTLFGDYIPYGGRIPSFMVGDRSPQTWQTEKDMFGDVYIDVPNYSVSDYYRIKGSSYIQVEGKGLYHTGLDILELGVPLFDVQTKLRLRTSKHINRKTGVPTDITLALVFKRNSLRSSNLCLVTRVEGSQFQTIS
jgi:hypothetical protein